MTRLEAVEDALVLALTAPDDEQARRGAALAARMARDFGLTPAELEAVKQRARARWLEDREHSSS